jgi:diguanylate cyclase (GGDEF)-like protein
MTFELMPGLNDNTDNTLASLLEKLDEARQRIQHLERLVELDPLCNVLNRRGFDRALNCALERLARYDEGAVLVYMDLDGFKSINDSCGHSIGDEALKFFAAFVSNHCRMSDSIARLGGDEFALLLPYASIEDAKCKIAELKDGLSHHAFVHNGFVFPLLFSAGCILLTQETASQAISRADAMMYLEKKRALPPHSYYPLEAVYEAQYSLL